MIRILASVVLLFFVLVLPAEAQFRLRRGGPVTVGEAVTDPELASLPMISFSDISWDGGFCVDDGAAANPFDGGWVGFSPNWTFGYDPADETIYTTSDVTTLNKHGVAHKAIPALVLSGTIASLNKATFVASTPIIEPTEGIYTDSTNGVYTGDPTSSALTDPTGFLIYGSYLCGTYQYYYGESDPDKPFYCRPKNLTSTGSVVGMRNLTTVGTDTTKRMAIAGCGNVPAQWQAALGAPAFCMAGATFSIINTQSRGPSLFVFDPADIIDGSGNLTGLIYYPGTHQTLGGWDLGDWADGNPATNSEMMDKTTQITGAAIIKGTRTTIFYGVTGNQDCYGLGLSDPDDPLIGTPTGDGDDVYCWDPANSVKSNHGYPYEYRVWLVDTLDLAAVKAGTMNPWDVIPYEFTTFEFPHVPGSTHQKRSRGLQYNETTQKLYFAQDNVCAGSNSAIWRASVDITP